MKTIKILAGILIVGITSLVVYVGYIYFTDLRIFDDVETEKVEFQSGEITLSGEFSKPNDVEKPGIFVFIHGSGKTPKEDLRWYARKANEHGYASLTFDKRGVSNSEGSEEFYRYFDFETLANDVNAAVQYASTRPDIDSSNIYLFGVSQGGWVAPLAASQSEVSLSGMIIISGSVVPVNEDRIFERSLRLKNEGFTTEEVEKATQLQISDQNYSIDSTSYNEFKLLWDRFKDERWFRRVYLSDDPISFSSPWRQHHSKIIDFDPLPILQTLDIPVVWIFGDPNKDDLGPINQSVKNLEELKEGGKEYLILSYSGYDHNLEQKVLFDLLPTYANWEDNAFNFLK